MNKFVLSALVLNLGALTAQDFPPCESFTPPPPAKFEPILRRPKIEISYNSNHQVFPRFFFKKHREGGYNYDMYGFGVGYQYKQPDGLNFKCLISTNLDGSKPYVEEDINVSYEFKNIENFSFLPYLASKTATHQIGKVNGMKYIVTKGSLYAGVGLKPELIENLDVELKLGLSRDLYNVLLHTDDEQFTGRKFSNPFGFAAELGISYDLIESLSIVLDTSFAKGFKNEFRNYGGGLSANWRF